MKKKSHQMVRSHFLMLVGLCLILSLFGNEFNFSNIGLNGDKSYLSYLKDPKKLAETGGERLSNTVMAPVGVFEMVARGQIAGRENSSEEKSTKEKSSEAGIIKELEEKDSKVFGHTRGVLAQLVNSVSSGQLYTAITEGIYSVTHSDQLTAFLFSAGYILFFLVIFIFLKCVYSAAVRRIFLEARVYEKIPMVDLLHFAAVKKWAKASWAMFVQVFFWALWTLTIIGGIIKYYSYFAAPYIVAENPDVGPLQAISLSRKMMNGHKMELFKLQITMAGWFVLSFLTLGLSDLAYGIAWRMGCYAEFYARVRKDALSKGLEGTGLLDDVYLFAKADRICLYEEYFDIVDEVTLIHEEKVILSGARAFVAKWFSIWVGSLKEKHQYDEIEGRTYAIQNYRNCMSGLSYPLRLNPRWKEKKDSRTSHFSYMRSYSIWTLFLFFIIFSVIGWSWEVLLHYMQTGEFANRGTMAGPWLPIYGSGGLIALLVCNRFRSHPALEFIASTALCGGIEYFASWSLEMQYHKRWWSYDGYFLNINGRICAEGLLVFGVASCIIVYFAAPLFDFILSKIKPKILIGICVVLGAVFMIDVVYANAHPNISRGAVEDEVGF